MNVTPTADISKLISSNNVKPPNFIHDVHSSYFVTSDLRIIYYRYKTKYTTLTFYIIEIIDIII